MVQFVPTTSVEFETLTTQPAWGDDKEVDVNPGDKADYWKTLNFFTRDLRLGNISFRYDDILYLEDMLGLTHTLLSMREGAFFKQSWLALSRVASTTELSQSRGGFMRKNARTVRSSEETTLRDDTRKGGFFGKKKREGGL